MKKEGTWLTAAVCLIAGVALIIFHGSIDLLRWVMEIIGLLIVIPAVWLLLANIFSRQNRNYLAIFAGAIALCMGLWICLQPSLFASIVVYVFAVVLILLGLWHIISLSLLGKQVNVPLWLFIIPALLIVAGLAFIFTGLKMMTTALVLVMGIALVCIALNTVVELVRGRRATAVQ